MLLADSAFLGGRELLPLLVLALGGAMFAGNVAAIVRPPEARQRRRGDLAEAPVTRSVIMAAVGFIAAAWALASLLT